MAESMTPQAAADLIRAELRPFISWQGIKDRLGFTLAEIGDVAIYGRILPETWAWAQKLREAR